MLISRRDSVPISRYLLLHIIREMGTESLREINIPFMTSKPWIKLSTVAVQLDTWRFDVKLVYSKCRIQSDEYL